MRPQGTRVNLTLPDDVVAVLDRMAKVTGAGRATIIREWLIGAAPQLGEFARALEQAQQKNVDAFSIMANVVDGLTDQTQQLSLNIKRDRRAARKRAK